MKETILLTPRLEKNKGEEVLWASEQILLIAHGRDQNGTGIPLQTVERTTVLPADIPLRKLQPMEE